MIPLRVALVHYDTPRMLDRRSVGIWSYPVPEFDVTHFPTKGNDPVIDATSWEGVFDVIVQEDNRCWPEYINPAGIPMFYYVVDSTLSAEHLRNRQRHAEKFDVVMVDLDDLARFDTPSRQAWRVSHCVNDKLYKPRGPKTVDVGFHCFRKGPGGERRSEVAGILKEFCELRGYSFDASCPGGEAYAAALAREKVTVQVNRNAFTRAHRTFDAMACETALLSETLPVVSGEIVIPNYHYAPWDTIGELKHWISYLLDKDRWMRFAHRGWQMVTPGHTWRTRAGQMHRRMTRFLEYRALEKAHAATHSPQDEGPQTP